MEPMKAAAMHIWNVIRSWFQERIEALEVQEASFPMFLSHKSLEKVSIGVPPPQLSQPLFALYVL